MQRVYPLMYKAARLGVELYMKARHTVGSIIS